MPILRYAQARDIKKSLVSYMNKVFDLNNSWVKDSVEVITLKDDNSPSAYEQYPWDNENYPIAVVFSEGSTDDHWAIDSRISDYRETIKLGVTPRTYTTLGVNPIAAALRPELSSLILHSAEILVKNIGPYEEPITIQILDTSGGEPNAVLASGSIKGQHTAGIEWLRTAISPTITLDQNTTYAISAVAPSGSYYWFIDNDITSGVTPSATQWVSDGATWTTTSDQSPITKIHGPAVRRLGGGINTSLRIFVEAKDLSTVQKITDLLFVYLHLAKHGNALRSEQLTTPNITNMDYDFVSNLSDEGIYIISVNKGAETVRNRGNDRLFSVDLSVACYSSWSEDFVLPTLKEIDIDINSITKVYNKYKL